MTTKPDDLLERLRAAKIPHEAIGAAIGRNRVAATRLMNGQRRLQRDEEPKLEVLLERWATNSVQLMKTLAPALTVEEATDPDAQDHNVYLPVDILPTYAGMGGGGTGDGEIEKALIPRYLVEDVFRGRAVDFVVVRVRGNSMEPVFHHDDELLIDKRDTSPSQPGPFALWDREWNEYVVKNVERVEGSKLRIFSSNTEYREQERDATEVQILGRPVWFGRRL